MTSLSPQGRQRDGSKTPDRDPQKQYSSLKKSLSAPYSLTSTDKPEEPDSHTHGSNNAPPTPQSTAQANPPLSVSIPKPSAAADVALAALHYLPTPLLVLSSMKTVILANEAMGRLLGMESPGSKHDSVDTQDTEDEQSVLDGLLGRSLSQIGVAIVQDGQRVWVGWEVSTAFGILCLIWTEYWSRNSWTILLRRWIRLPYKQKVVHRVDWPCEA